MKTILNLNYVRLFGTIELLMSENNTLLREGQSDPTKRQAATTVIRGLAFVLANARTYGLSHNITLNAVEIVAQALAAYQRAYGSLTFELKEGNFYVDGFPGDMHTPALDAFAKQLSDLGAKDMTFDTDLTKDELVNWFRVVFTGGSGVPGSFGDALAAAGFKKIRSGNVKLREVAEDEDVFKKIDIEAASKMRNASRLKTAGRLLDSAPHDQPMPALKIDLGDPTVVDDLAKIAIPDSLSDATKPASQIADEAADRFQRLSDGLMAYPANRTQQGRHNLRKLLKKAEVDVTDRLSKLGADIEAVERLASKVKQLVEDLAIDGIAARYVKLREQASEDEARLKRRIRGAMRRGGKEAGKEFGDKLLGAGLTEEMVRYLLSTAKGNGSGNGTGNGTNAAHEESAPPPPEEEQPPQEEPEVKNEEPSQLATLLTQLKKTETGSGELPTLVENILGEMSKSLLDTQRSAKKQLDTLRKIVMIPSYRTDNPQLTRKQMQSLMAELGQQLKQPLSVVSGGVEMLLGNYFGELTDAQKPVIKLIFDSTAELTTLINRIIEVAGIPESLQPGDFGMPNPTTASPAHPQ